MAYKEWSYPYDLAHTIVFNRRVDMPGSETRHQDVFNAKIGWSSELVVPDDGSAPYNLVEATYWYQRTGGWRTWVATNNANGKTIFIRCTSDSGNVVMDDLTSEESESGIQKTANSYQMQDKSFVFNTDPSKPVTSGATVYGGSKWQCFGPAEYGETGPFMQMKMRAKVYANTAKLYAAYDFSGDTACAHLHCTDDYPDGYPIQLSDLTQPPVVSWNSVSYNQAVGEKYVLSWTGKAQGSLAGSQIDHYELQVSTNKTSWQTISSYLTATSYEWPCKADNVTRYFQVRVCNKVGQWSSWVISSGVQAKILTPVFTNSGKKLFIEDDTKYNNYATDSAFKKAHNAVKQVKINEKDCHVIANNWKHIVRWTAGQYVYEYRYQIKVWPPQMNAPNVESTPDSEWGHEDTTTALSLQNQNPMNYGAQPGGWIAYRVQAVGLDSPNHSLHSGWVYSLPIRVKGSLLVCQGGWKVAEPKFSGNRKIQQIFVRQFGQWKELY